MKKKKLLLLIATLLSVAVFSSCTPEQLALWGRMTPTEQNEIIQGMKSPTCVESPPTHKFRRNVANCNLAWMIGVTNGNGDPTQFACLDNVIMAESAWNNIPNAAGGADYGIPQAYPGSKMASHGADWRTNVVVQIRWLYSYIKDRYKTACAAWKFKQANGIY